MAFLILFSFFLSPLSFFLSLFLLLLLSFHPRKKSSSKSSSKSFFKIFQIIRVKKTVTAYGHLLSAATALIIASTQRIQFFFFSSLLSRISLLIRLVFISSSHGLKASFSHGIPSFSCQICS